MSSKSILVALFLLPPALIAQNSIPSGTILPVSLDTGLNAAKVHPGQQIRATIMQDVPGTPIRRRARVEGHVVQASASKNGQSRLEVQFDSVMVDGRLVPMKTSLRAIASLEVVREAQTPEDGGSRGLTPASWTTEQIGGEQFYRGGPVARGATTVGETTPWGALAVPRTQPGMSCRGMIGENRGPQALWLFSSDACGVYGFPDVRIEDAGRSDFQGTIVLVSSNGKLKLGGGTGLLLRVFSPETKRASGSPTGSTGK